MSLTGFEPLVRSLPRYGELIRKVQETVERAGYDPILSVDAVASIAGLQLDQVAFVFDRLVENGFLTKIIVEECLRCSEPLREDGSCRCPPDLEPATITNQRYRMVEPGIMQLSDSLMEKARIGVITALPKEAAAVLSMLENTRRLVRESRVYDLGTVPAFDGGEHAIVHTSMGDMGNNMAVARATLLHQHFPNLQHIIMVGIAGGVPYPQNPERHVRLGDIIISDRYGVIQYDFRKAEKGKYTERNRPVPPAADLLAGVTRIQTLEAEGKRPWEVHIARGLHLPNAKRPDDSTDILVDEHGQPLIHPTDHRRKLGVPRAFYGPIASSSTLLKDSTQRDYLRDQHRVLGVEMEGSGIADATWDRQIGYLVIRGICDYCDENKTDEWQEYAAVAAAAYFRALMYELPSLSQ